MKRSRFSEQQIAFILRQAEEGTTVEEVCRKAGISEATYYNWRKKYAGLMPSEMRRLRQLEEENQRLKKLVADLALDKEMLQASSAAKCDACPEACDGRSRDGGLAGERAPRLPRPAGRSVDLPLPFEADRAGAPDGADQGDRRDARALRLSPDPRAPAARRLARQRQAGLPAVS
jgi:putative transposase